MKPGAGETFNPGELRERTMGRVYPPAILGRRRDMSDGPKRVYQVLYDRAGENGRCWPSFETIAYDTGKSVRQVKNDVAELERLRLIQHQRRRRESNAYEFVWHEMFDVQPIALQEPQEVQETACQEILEVQDSVSKKCSVLHGNSISEFSHSEKHYTSPQNGDGFFGAPAREKVQATPGKRRSRREPNLTAEQREWFDSEFWPDYWLKVAKKEAMAAFEPITTREKFEAVNAAKLRQRPAMMQREPKHRPHASSWLRGERFLDEDPEPCTLPAPSTGGPQRGYVDRWERHAQIRDQMFRDLIGSRLKQ